MPLVLARLDRAICLVELMLPLLEILLLWKLMPGAQVLEHRAVRRSVVEESHMQIEQRAERIIVERQLAVDVEYRDAGRELIEDAAMRLDHAAELGAHVLRFSAVYRDACAAGRPRRIDHVENAPLAF